MKTFKVNDRPINLQFDKEIFLPGETKILYDKLEDGEKNLYIVSTPLQLLGAIEAQHYFNTHNNVLIILFFLIGDGKNINQLFKLSEIFPYNKLITYQNSNGIKLRSYLHYLDELTKYQYHYTFFGYATPIYRRMVANIKYKKLYMLDDGVHSITVHKQIHSQKNGTGKDFSLTGEEKNIRKKLRNIIYFTKGIQADSELKDLNFFTMFDLEKYNDIITHDFSYVRSIFMKSNKSDDKIFILGQPLKKAMKMETSTYIEYLTEILHKFKNKDKVYIPHRTEQIGEELGYLLYSNKVLILHINSPIEIFFMNHSINPEYVFSFMSSALFTIKKMFPSSKPEYIEIDTSPYSEFHQKNIQLIYDNYKKDGIEKFEP